MLPGTDMNNKMLFLISWLTNIQFGQLPFIDIQLDKLLITKAIYQFRVV